MDYRVYHPDLMNQPLTVNSSTVSFDANGISEEMSPEDYRTLLSIPGYRSLNELQRELAAEELDTFLCPPTEDLGQGDPLPAEVLPTPEEVESDDSGQPLPEHEEDRTLLQEVLANPVPADCFAALPLIQRLDVASNPELPEGLAETLFATEGKGKKSKRVLAELNRSLITLRTSRSAHSVTERMIKANYPRLEEQ